MLKTLTNRQAASMAESCERWIDDVGLLGYACARNSRRLADATLEVLASKMMRSGSSVARSWMRTET